jgi:hypothetical protein
MIGSEKVGRGGFACTGTSFCFSTSLMYSSTNTATGMAFDYTELARIFATEPKAVILLQVYAPNGDEYWTVGETKQISWTSTHFDSQVNIYLDEYRYCSYYQPCPAVLQKSYTIATNIPDNGSYFWNVGSSLSGTVASGFYQIRITGANKTDISDTSDYPFSEHGRDGQLLAPAYSAHRNTAH